MSLAAGQPSDAEPVSLPTNGHSPLGSLGVLTALALPGEGGGKELATAQSRQHSPKPEPVQSP